MLKLPTPRCLVNAELRAFAQAVDNNENVFLFGAGGTGKTLAMNDLAAAYGDDALIVTPTHASALLIRGSGSTPVAKTIASVFGMRVDRFECEDDVKKYMALLRRGYERFEMLFYLLNEVRILVIDEVGQVSRWRFDAMIEAIAEVRKHDPRFKDLAAPLYGLQLVTVGDFFQTEPVFQDYKNPRDADMYFTLSPFCAQIRPSYHLLVRSLRHDGDPEFAEAMNALRYGDLDAKAIDDFNKRCLISKDRQPPPETITLVGRNDRCAELNAKYARTVAGKEHMLLVRASVFDKEGNASLQNVLPCKLDAQAMATYRKVVDAREVEEAIKVKDGAIVRLTALQGVGVTFAPGTYGRVTIEEKGGEVRVWFSEMLAEGMFSPTYVEVQRVDVSGWNEQQTVRVTVSQWAFTMGIASTVHSVQGATLPCVVVNPDLWANGQLYVALSRVRCFASLYLEQPIQRKHQRASDYAKKLEAEIRAAVCARSQ